MNKLGKKAKLQMSERGGITQKKMLKLRRWPRAPDWHSRAQFISDKKAMEDQCFYVS